MSGRLEGVRALITGASRGIGRAISEAFAREGADLVITARRTEDLAQTADAVRALGRRVECLAWDVRDVDQAGARLDEATSLLGGLEVLVNNAGVVRLPQGTQDPTGELAWDLIMDVNLKALYFLCEAAAQRMEGAGGGAIINLASDAGLRPAPGAYAISKWGVVGYTQGLARKVAHDGVRVNAIAPGPTATGMMGCEDGKPREFNGPLKRFSLPEEIADVAVFLASRDARAVFGQTIVVNSATS